MTKIMMLKFSKYHGTGNDFIMLSSDDVQNVQFSPSVVSTLCNRNFGIGADGLIIVGKTNQADFEMKYYNSDGHPGTMCGNGGRCAVAFAMKNNLIQGSSVKFLASDGFHDARLCGQSGPHPMVELSMNDTEEYSLKMNDFYFINTGSPHLIVMVDDVNAINVYEVGRKLRYSNELAPHGANVNFVMLRKDGIFVRTYERGVENETLSCGTGVTAAAIVNAALSNNPKKSNSVNVFTKGGLLKVSFELDGKKAKQVKLTGPAAFVFDGQIEYPLI
jgi:diaminopimelate epimerase